MYLKTMKKIMPLLALKSVCMYCHGNSCFSVLSQAVPLIYYILASNLLIWFLRDNMY